MSHSHVNLRMHSAALIPGLSSFNRSLAQFTWLFNPTRMNSTNKLIPEFGRRACRLPTATMNTIPNGSIFLAECKPGTSGISAEHRFLLEAVRRHLALAPGEPGCRSTIHFGGGLGGWVAYLHRRLCREFAEWGWPIPR